MLLQEGCWVHWPGHYEKSAAAQTLRPTGNTYTDGQLQDSAVLL